MALGLRAVEVKGRCGQAGWSRRSRFLLPVAGWCEQEVVDSRAGGQLPSFRIEERCGRAVIRRSVVLLDGRRGQEVVNGEVEAVELNTVPICIARNSIFTAQTNKLWDGTVRPKPY